MSWKSQRSPRRHAVCSRETTRILVTGNCHDIRNLSLFDCCTNIPLSTNLSFSHITELYCILFAVFSICASSVVSYETLSTSSSVFKVS